MNQTVFKNTPYLLVFVKKLGNGEDHKKYESVIGSLRLEVHDDISEADEEWMGDSISGHHQNVSLVQIYQHS